MTFKGYIVFIIFSLFFIILVIIFFIIFFIGFQVYYFQVETWMLSLFLIILFIICLSFSLFYFIGFHYLLSLFLNAIINFHYSWIIICIIQVFIILYFITCIIFIILSYFENFSRIGRLIGARFHCKSNAIWAAWWSLDAGDTVSGEPSFQMPGAPTRGGRGVKLWYATRLLFSQSAESQPIQRFQIT